MPSTTPFPGRTQRQGWKGKNPHPTRRKPVEYIESSHLKVGPPSTIHLKREVVPVRGKGNTATPRGYNASRTTVTSTSIQLVAREASGQQGTIGKSTPRQNDTTAGFGSHRPHHGEAKWESGDALVRTRRSIHRNPPATTGKTEGSGGPTSLTLLKRHECTHVLPDGQRGVSKCVHLVATLARPHVASMIRPVVASLIRSLANSWQRISGPANCTLLGMVLLCDMDPTTCGINDHTRGSVDLMSPTTVLHSLSRTMANTAKESNNHTPQCNNKNSQKARAKWKKRRPTKCKEGKSK